MNLAGAALAVVGGLLGLAQYLRFRSRKDRQAAIGNAFKDVVTGLGSDVLIERLASAALVRRFFDSRSEYSLRGLPYASSAVTVIGAALRSEPCGSVQKLLADGLAMAPDLRRADLQRANLVNCYWGRDPDGHTVDASDADFFRADLSGGSLRGATLKSAVFREAHLRNTVFDESDCTRADFHGADLKGSTFRGTILVGARFKNAVNIPAPVLRRLQDGIFAGEDPIPDGADGWKSEVKQGLRVFLSVPSVMDASHRLPLEQIVSSLTKCSAETVRYEPADYGVSQPLLEVTRRISECDAVIAYGAPQLVVDTGAWRKGTPAERSANGMCLPTPWNQIEAGIASGLGKPLLLVNAGTEGGVFELDEVPGGVMSIDIARPGGMADLDQQLAIWAENIVYRHTPAQPLAQGQN